MMVCNARIPYGILVACFSVFLAASCSIEKGIQGSNLKYVDPTIGNVAPLLQPTRPRVQQPNEMMRMYPYRADHLDDQIEFFPMIVTHHRSGEIMGIMPVAGAFPEKEVPISAWDQELETVEPYYYRTWLEDYSITLEFSPGRKTGYFRFHFPEGATKKLYLRPLNGSEWAMPTSGTIVGEESFAGMKAYAHGAFSHDGSISKFTAEDGSTSTWISWPDTAPNTIEFKYGISYIDGDQARKNLETEIPDWQFESIRNQAMEAWSDVINQIEVEGGTEAYRRTFYTSLYRSYERMVNITEDGRYYSNYDGKVHKEERPFYVDDWCWDTYLTLHPLRYILRPELESDMIQSYIRQYEQGGWLPNFPVLTGDSPTMNAFHSTIMILDAWRKGITNFDSAVAFEAMKKNALEATMIPWRNGPKGELDDFYHENGFFPALHPGEVETVARVDDFEKRQSVAVTLGHSYDDWALAQMAKELGYTEDYKTFIKRAENYKNLYWEEKGFFMPKDKDGNWINIDPKFDGGMGGRDYYDENNGWTYLWNVQHDVGGLMELMGGQKVFEERLDQLFREDLGRSKYENYARFPDFTGIVGQYSMGNEPSFHIPYLYNFTGSPWKTQKKIRMLLNTWFKDNIFGIPGDEDGGAMTAFVVFSAMGFYPVKPGVPIYTIGSPLFTKITIHLPNGKDFILSAPKNSKINKYIQSARLNGKALNSPWFTHEDLMKGGKLELEMGPYPNKDWGTEESELRKRVASLSND